MLIRSPEQDIDRVLFTEEQIAARVAEIGKELSVKFRGEKPLMLCVLRGAAFFFTDLCRKMDCLMDMDFISASSYFDGTKSSGTVRLMKDSSIDMTGRHSDRKPRSPAGGCRRGRLRHGPRGRNCPPKARQA